VVLINQNQGHRCLHGLQAVREALRGKRRITLDNYATEAARRLEGEIAVLELGLPPVRFAVVAALVAQQRQ
jgi:hypothetical protein